MNETIKIANAPCSWGVLEFDLEGKAAGYEQVLDEIAESGYTGTELGDWGFMPTDPPALSDEIKKRRLTLLGAFVPVSFADESAHREGIERALKTAALMHDAGYGEAFIVLADNNGTVEFRTKNAGRIPVGDQPAGSTAPLDSHSLTPAQMQTFARGVEKTAKAVKDKYGMRTVFHHHAAGYIETPEEIEALLESTDPNLVGLCFDTGHYEFGGGKDSVAFLDKHWSRIWHVHFKDFSPDVAHESAANSWDYFESVKHGVFCELGKGDVDFRAVKDFLLSRSYRGWIVVEQDVLPGMGEPKQCAINNRNYLQKIGL